MRALKFHERKLLKKVDFLRWKKENNLRELQVRHERVSLAGLMLKKMLLPACINCTLAMALTACLFHGCVHAYRS